MFGIGSTELLVILVVALIVLGPKSLASVSRSLGKAMGEFRRVSTDFQRALNVEAAEEERRAAVKTAPKAADDGNATSGAKSAEPAAGETRENAGPPPDTPLGQAIAKAKAQAGSQDGKA